MIEPTATPPYPAPDDPRVVAARNALTAATADHDRISSLLAAAIEAIASVHAASDKASGNLASDAIRDLKPTDLDEVRAACRGGEGPPTIVQIVVCCCCSLLELANKKPPESTKSSSTTPLGPLPPLSPRGGRPPTTPRRGSTTSRTAAAPIVPWDQAVRRLGNKDFKPSLLSFDARRLLAEDATEVLAAVKQRIALDVEENENAPYPVSEEGNGGSKASSTRRKSKEGSTSSKWKAAAASSTERRSSLASVAARARRAAIAEAGDDGLSALLPLSHQDASYGSATIGALFLWCARVLANAEKIREVEAAERERLEGGERERSRLEVEVEAAKAAVARAKLELEMALADLRRRREEEEEAKAKAEAAAKEAAEREAAEKARAAERARREKEKAAEEEEDRKERMRREQRKELDRQEEEATRRRAEGRTAVLEEVDVVIKQKVKHMQCQPRQQHTQHHSPHSSLPFPSLYLYRSSSRPDPQSSRRSTSPLSYVLRT